MTLKHPRINVTFEDTVVALLKDLANKESKSVSSLVRELTIDALELREDRALSHLAESLDKNDAVRYSHEDVWK